MAHGPVSSGFRSIPGLVNKQQAIENGPFIVDLPIKMVMFNSYVKLLEGKLFLWVFQSLFLAKHFEKWPSLALENEIVTTPQDYGVAHESHGFHKVFSSRFNDHKIKAASQLVNSWKDTSWLVVEPYPSEKIWVGQLGLSFPIYGKIKNNPNHQPAIDISTNSLPETIETHEHPWK